MDYSEMTAAELKAECLKRDIKPSRAKTDMIEDLKARDAADELTRLSQELDLPDEPLPGSEPSQATEPQPTSPRSGEDRVWLADGRLFKAYEKEDRWLDDDEHEENLRDIVEEAVIRGKDYYGPAYRVDDPDVDEWIYAVNVR